MTIYQPTIQMNAFIDGDGITYQDTFLDENKNISFINGVDSVAQTVKNSISLWKGEYEFNTTLGSNWDNILGQPLNRLLLNTYIQTAVLQVKYVVNIISIDYITDNTNRFVGVIVKYNNTDKIVSTVNVNI